jgi:hypothetical protein
MVGEGLTRRPAHGGYPEPHDPFVDSDIARQMELGHYDNVALLMEEKYPNHRPIKLVDQGRIVATVCAGRVIEGYSDRAAVAEFQR